MTTDVTAKTLLVANPTARSGKARRAIERAQRYLGEAHLQPEFFSTQPNGETVPLLAERLEAGDVARVVYLGGDGTFAEAAKGIILARERFGTNVPLGMLPMGTANDQGRSYGIMAGEKALARNVEIIALGCEQWLDVGHVSAFDTDGNLLRQDLWFDSFGLGLSAEILAQRNRDRDRLGKLPFIGAIYRDKLVYAGASVNSLVRSIVSPSSFAGTVTVDGEAHNLDAITDLVVKGTMLYGGDWIFLESAKADDGKFEVVAIKGHADWLAMTIGRHKRNPITDDDKQALGIDKRTIWQGREIQIQLDRPRGMPPLPAQIDGEEFVAADRFHIENLAQHLRIIVPEDAHWV